MKCDRVYVINMWVRRHLKDNTAGKVVSNRISQFPTVWEKIYSKMKEPELGVLSSVT